MGTPVATVKSGETPEPAGQERGAAKVKRWRWSFGRRAVLRGEIVRVDGAVRERDLVVVRVVAALDKV